MNSEKLWFSFFVILALTLNFGFVYGEIANPDHHNRLELFFTFLVSVICTILKFGDRTNLGSLLLATSMVADFQLFLAIAVWIFHTGPIDDSGIALVVSLSAGALVANFISVITVIFDAISIRK